MWLPPLEGPYPTPGTSQLLQTSSPATRPERPSLGSEPAQNKHTGKPQWFVAGIFYSLAPKQEFPHWLGTERSLSPQVALEKWSTLPTLYVLSLAALTFREGFPGEAT